MMTTDERYFLGLEAFLLRDTRKAVVVRACDLGGTRYLTAYAVDADTLPKEPNSQPRIRLPEALRVNLQLDVIAEYKK
jgi:hypothetical protein